MLFGAVSKYISEILLSMRFGGFYVSTVRFGAVFGE